MKQKGYKSTGWWLPCGTLVTHDLDLDHVIMTPHSIFSCLSFQSHGRLVITYSPKQILSEEVAWTAGNCSNAESSHKHPWLTSHLHQLTHMNFSFVASVLSPTMRTPTKPSSWRASTHFALIALPNFLINKEPGQPSSNVQTVGLTHNFHRMG